MDLSLDKLYMIAHDIQKVEIPEQILGAVAVAVDIFEQLKPACKTKFLDKVKHPLR